MEKDWHLLNLQRTAGGIKIMCSVTCVNMGGTDAAPFVPGVIRSLSYYVNVMGHLGHVDVTCKLRILIAMC